MRNCRFYLNCFRAVLFGALRQFLQILFHVIQWYLQHTEKPIKKWWKNRKIIWRHSNWSHIMLDQRASCHSFSSNSDLLYPSHSSSVSLTWCGSWSQSEISPLNHQSCKVWHFSWPRFCVTFKSKITLLVSDSQTSESQGQGLSFLRFQSINALRFATDHKNTKVPRFFYHFCHRKAFNYLFWPVQNDKQSDNEKSFHRLTTFETFPRKGTRLFLQEL